MIFHENQIILDRQALLTQANIVKYTVIEPSIPNLVIKNELGQKFNINYQGIISITDALTIFKKEFYKKTAELNKLEGTLNSLRTLSEIKDITIQLPKGEKNDD